MLIHIQNKENPAFKSYLKKAETQAFGELNDTFQAFGLNKVYLKMNDDFGNEFSEFASVSLPDDTPVSKMKEVQECIEETFKKYSITKALYSYVYS